VINRKTITIVTVIHKRILRSHLIKYSIHPNTKEARQTTVASRMHPRTRTASQEQLGIQKVTEATVVATPRLLVQLQALAHHLWRRSQSRRCSHLSILSQRISKSSMRHSLKVIANRTLSLNTKTIVWLRRFWASSRSPVMNICKLPKRLSIAFYKYSVTKQHILSQKEPLWARKRLNAYSMSTWTSWTCKNTWLWTSLGNRLLQQVWHTIQRQANQRSISGCRVSTGKVVSWVYWIMRSVPISSEDTMKSIKHGTKKEINMKWRFAYRLKKDLPVLISL